MKALILDSVAPLQENSLPLRLVELPEPSPKQGEILVKVLTCGVCHTALDEIEGRAPPPSLPVTLGHEVVGTVAELGAGAHRFQVGQRVGVGWIHSSTGSIDENLSTKFRATGRDVDGGYAEFMTVPENYAYPIPEEFSDTEAAPMLCAGAIGYRALSLTNISNGDPLGLMGFGGSGPLVLPLARHLFPDSHVFVFARDAPARALATDLGATWIGDTNERAPEQLQAIIDTTPGWTPVVAALAKLRPGGRLVINAIRKEDHDKAALAELIYHEHLWMEREIKSVANITHHDIGNFLPIAASIPLRPTVETYPLEEANAALIALKFRPVRGTKVLTISH